VKVGDAFGGWRGTSSAGEGDVNAEAAGEGDVNTEAMWWKEGKRIEIPVKKRWNLQENRSN
jgi:hypothetical protein